MRPKGHVRDVTRPSGLVHHEHLVGDVLVQPSARLPAVIDEQVGSDCTGSYDKLVEPWCAARGIPCDPVSRRFGYTLGRALAAPETLLRDVGANPASVVDGMRIFGVVPERACPSYDLARINDPVTLYDLEVARTFVVKDIAVIDEQGAQLCASIRRAIAGGFPVGFGMEVDASYEQLGAGVTYTGPSGPSLGGHAQRIVGYRPGAFLVAGSWGTAWADDGFVWIDDAFIGGPYCYDFYALNFAPAVHA